MRLLLLLLFALLLTAQPAWAQQLTDTQVTLIGSPQSGGAYSDGEIIRVAVAFPYSVSVNTANPPLLVLAVGVGTTRIASYAEHGIIDGQFRVDFSYEVQAADEDRDGIDVVVFQLGSGDATSVRLWRNSTYVAITQNIPIGVTFPDHKVNSIAYGDDGFIDVSTLAQLNAIRWDLDGDGVPQGDMGSHRAAFPNQVRNLGCPVAGCRGYELVRNLALSGVNNIMPIGTETTPFTAVFKGNGHFISGLSIHQAIENVGLFGANAGTIFGLALVAPSVSGNTNVGAMIGYNQPSGIVSASYATAVAVTGTKAVGGLVGRNSGNISASYVTGAVTGGANTSRHIGGLVGLLDADSGRVAASYARASVSGYEVIGGLIGRMRRGTRVTATYAASDVSGTRRIGGLVGRVGNTTEIYASYARSRVSGDVHVGGLLGLGHVVRVSVNKSYWDVGIGGNDSDGGTSKTTVQLQTPTDYGSGIYAFWNVDIDGDGNSDDPWDFGTSSEYPILQYGGIDRSFQREFGDEPIGESISVAAHVFLQGAYDRADGTMRIPYGNLLPTRQPYAAAPWRYGRPTDLSGLLGNAAFGLSRVTQTVVDWVLIELRTTPQGIAMATPSTMFDRRAALLLSDGSVAGVDPGAAAASVALAPENVAFRAAFNGAADELYVLMHHRNHLSVMTTATSGAGCAADYCADFARRQTWQDGQYDLGGGLFAMFAGDTDRNRRIDVGDTRSIRRHNTAAISGSAQYTADGEARYVVDGDLDFDGDVLSGDRFFILINHGASACAVCSP